MNAKKTRIIPEERRGQILKYLADKKTATIEDICKTFDISEVTVRRDINKLSLNGLIKKVYGGVTIPVSYTSGPVFVERRNKNLEEKRRIAAEAVKRINDEDTILIESGTTCLELVKLIHQKKNLTIISSGAHIINALCDLRRQKLFDGEIICSGGIWREQPDIFIGPHAVEFYQKVKINVAFIGILALNLEDGVMLSNQFEAELQRHILSCSQRRIALADHTKFDKVSFTKVGSLSLFDEIITDSGIDQSTLDRYKKAKVKITIC